jgi:putative restriction endonuclease
MVSLSVGVTDYDWFRFLAPIPDLAEANFWQPVVHHLKHFDPANCFFSSFTRRVISLSEAVSSPTLQFFRWEAFGLANARSLEEMRGRIAFYRRETIDARQDYNIGCRLLGQPFFLREDAWIPVPASWSRTIVSGRTYDTADGTSGRLLPIGWQTCPIAGSRSLGTVPRRSYGLALVKVRLE